MSDLTLRHPVQTLDSKMLLPAGAALSADNLETLISSHGAVTYETCSLLQYGSVREDLIKLLGILPYQRIFPSEEHIAEVMKDMETVHLAVPLLQTMDYFRQHDFYTYRHFLMVFAMSTLLAKDLIPDYQDRIRLIATGPTHDVGKICVPLHILKKTTPLTRRELSILQHHAAAGHVLLSYYLGDAQTLASRVARDHHERNDGSGYPRGILLSDLMVEIIAACDVYDALIAPRPYRPTPFDNRTALEEITRMAEDGVIGWDVVKALVTHNRKTAAHYCENVFSREKRGTPPSGNVHGIIAEEDDTGTTDS